MEKKSAFGPSAISGVYLGAALIVFSLLTFLMDVDLESPIKYFSYLILAVGLWWSIVSYRDKHMGGYIDYKGAFAVGFYTALIASLIAGIFTYVYVEYIDTTLIEQVMLKAEESIIEQNPNMSDEQIEQSLEMAGMFTSPIVMSIFGFLGNLIASIFLSLIISIFAKRENKEVFEQK